MHEAGGCVFIDCFLSKIDFPFCVEYTLITTFQKGGRKNETIDGSRTGTMHGFFYDACIRPC
jgi:hypothetical protein